MQMVTIIIIMIKKMIAKILMVFPIEARYCSMFIRYFNSFNHPRNNPNESGTVIIPIFSDEETIRFSKLFKVPY